MELIKQYLIDSITLDDYTKEDGTNYNTESMSDTEKLSVAKATFESEMGWLIERSGEYEACHHWLSGLCSVLNIPFTYSDIIELAY